MNPSRAEREKILRKVSSLVEKRYFNPSSKGEAWDVLVEKSLDQILESSSPEEFEKEMQHLVSQLGTSHTGFFSPER